MLGARGDRRSRPPHPPDRVDRRPLGHRLFDLADSTPHGVAIVERRAGHQTATTFAEIAAWSFRLALPLARVAPAGSHVVYFGPPSIDAITLAFACALTGTTMLVPNGELEEVDVRPLVATTRPAVLVVDAQAVPLHLLHRLQERARACALPTHRDVAGWELPAGRLPLPDVSPHDSFIADVIPDGAVGWRVQRRLTQAEVALRAAHPAPNGRSTSILASVRRVAAGLPVAVAP